MADTTIVVPLSRYEYLVNLETRVAAVVEKIGRDGYIELQELLLTLRTDFAVDLAFEYQEKEHKIKEEQEKQEWKQKLNQ